MEKGIYCGHHIDPQTGQLGKPYCYDLDRMGLVAGPTGSGKTSRFLLNNVLGDNLDNASQLLFDTKGEISAIAALSRAKRGDQVAVIDPFGKLKELVGNRPEYRELVARGLVESVGFNVMGPIDAKGPYFYDDTAGIGEALIKIEGSSDPHWPESAQGCVTGLTMWEKVRHGAKANLANIRTMLTEAEQLAVDPITGKEQPISGVRYHARVVVAAHQDALNEEAAGRQHVLATAEVLGIIASLLARFLKENDEILSIRSTADTQLRWLLSPPVAADLNKPGIDFAELKRRPTCILVILPSERLRTHSVFLRLIIVTALRALYTAGGVRTHIFVDEMPALGYLPPLADAFALMRGFNVSITGIVQDINQIRYLYKDRWESFIANAGFVVCFGPNDMTTAEFMSKRLGNRTEQNVTVNHNTPAGMPGPDAGTIGESKTYVAQPVEFPQELFGMADGMALVFFAGLSYAAQVYLPHYTKLPGARHALPNPYRPG